MDAPTATAPAAIRARLLGRIEIEVGNDPIPDAAWPRRPMRSLLLLLLATPGRRLHREQVLDALWPESAPRTALNALYVTVHGLRRTLEPGLTNGKLSAYVDVASDLVSLRPGSVAWVDVDAFEAELRVAAGNGRREALAAALTLYGGDLLADERYVDWPVPRREHLRAAWRDAGIEYAALEREAGQPLAAVRHLERILDADPVDETVHRALMLSFSAAGRREDALRRFDRCVTILRDELGVQPGDETLELAASIRAASGAPAVVVPGAGPMDNLPAPPNPLIGRERELEDVLDLLARPGVRLVTITGPGGVGKTRLALEAAAAAADDVAGGVCFVSLAPVRDPDLVLPGIAQALGLRERTGQTTAEMLQPSGVCTALLIDAPRPS